MRARSRSLLTWPTAANVVRRPRRSERAARCVSPLRCGENAVRHVRVRAPRNVCTRERRDRQAVNEFVRILRTMPPNGLILDVRGNGGGYVNFGERILQTLSPSPIIPEPFHFMSTPFTLRIAEREDWLTEWAESLATRSPRARASLRAFQSHPLRVQRHRPDLPGPGRAHHRRVLLQHDGHLRGRVSGSRPRYILAATTTPAPAGLTSGTTNCWAS